MKKPATGNAASAPKATLQVRETTSFHFGNCLVEQVYDRATRSSELEVFHNAGTQARLSTFPIPTLNLEIRPLENDLVHKGRLILPERPQPYGSTSDLVEAIRAHVEKYVILPAEMRDVVVHYILLTWIYDRFETVPYLRFIGDLGVGKSRALKVVGQLCYHPFMGAGSASMAAIFRSLDMLGTATLSLDEVDFYAKSDAHQEMMTMLRQGFQKGTGVLRAEADGESFKPRDYEVFGPKVLAGRKDFPDAALESRCLRIYMQTGLPLRGIPAEVPPSYMHEVIALQNKLLQWRFDHYFSAIRTPAPLNNVEPRLLQLYNPLASVMNGSGGLTELQDAILALQEDMTEMRAVSLEGRTLAALVELHAEHGTGPAPVKVQMKVLAERVGKISGRFPTPKSVATVCRGLGLEVKRGNQGAGVEFSPVEHQPVLRRYGLAEPAPGGADSAIAA